MSLKYLMGLETHFSGYSAAASGPKLREATPFQTPPLAGSIELNGDAVSKLVAQAGRGAAWRVSGRGGAWRRGSRTTGRGWQAWLQ